MSMDRTVKFIQYPVAKSVLVALILIFLLSAPVTAQLPFDARSASLAYSNGAAVVGLQQMGGNPAVLALPQRFNFEFNLLSVNLAVFNNSFSKKDYDKYLTTGDSLTEGDIRDILGAIPDNGLKATGYGRINTLSFYTRNFSLGLFLAGNSFAQAPREIAELALQGNKDKDRRYSFDNLEGSGWGGFGISFSAARSFAIPQLEFLDFFSAGLTLKYLVGLIYGDIYRSDGVLINNYDEYLKVNMEGEVRESRGGRGMALDLGFFGRYKEKWNFSFFFSNLLGSLRWSKSNKLHTVLFQSDSLTLNALADSAKRETLITDTSYEASIGAFSTRLPVVMDLAVSYQWRPDVLFTGEYEQGLNSSMGGSTTPRIAFGAEYIGFPVVPLRIGMSFGGRAGFVFAYGFGINLNYWYLDFALLNQGGVLPGSSKGLELALSTRFRF